MNNAYSQITQPKNEPVKGYLPDSSERLALEEELQKQLTTRVEIPVIIGGKEVWSASRATFMSIRMINWTKLYEPVIPQPVMD